MKKILLSLLMALVTVLTAGLSACGRGDGGPIHKDPTGPEYNENQEEQYYSSFDPADYPIKDDVLVTLQMCGLGRAWMDEMASNYKKITGINVKVKENQDATTELTMKLKTGKQLSDLYFDWSSTTLMNSWANEGLLLELSDLVGKITEFRNDRVSPMSTFKDKYYTMPFAYNPAGFVYNQNYLDQIDSLGEYTKGQWPSTWQGLLDLCQATIKSDLRSGVNKVMPLVWGGTVKYYTTYLFDGLWHSQDPKGFEKYWSYTDKGHYPQELFRTDATLKAMQALRDLVNPQPTKDGTSYYPANAVNGSTGINHTRAQTMFLNGASVFVISGAWFENEMVDAIRDNSSYHFGKVPVLEKGKEPTAYINVPGEHFTIPSAAKNAEGGKQFLKFILQEQNLIRIMNKIQVPLAYKYDDTKIQFTEWGKEINEVIKSVNHTITYTHSDIMHCGALYVFGGEDPIVNMATKGSSADDVLQAEADYREKNWEYYLSLLPSDK